MQRAPARCVSHPTLVPTCAPCSTKIARWRRESTEERAKKGLGGRTPATNRCHTVTRIADSKSFRDASRGDVAGWKKMSEGSTTYQLPALREADGDDWGIAERDIFMEISWIVLRENPTHATNPSCRRDSRVST